MRTPYLLAHSVTVWCASLEGELYLGARNPESKRWPGWVDRDSRVRLRIADRVYQGTLEKLDDAATIERLRASYREKYALEQMAPNVRYWRYSSSGPRSPAPTSRTPACRR